jgi:hypothetical protein
MKHLLVPEVVLAVFYLLLILLLQQVLHLLLLLVLAVLAAQREGIMEATDKILFFLLSPQLAVVEERLLVVAT